MVEKVKLIWDFYGGHAKGTADHHCIHLDEYATKQNFEAFETGTEEVNEMHVLAFIILDKAHMISVRDALRPHRAEVAS
ncbi:MAG: hypothetical protein JXQ96_18870 [Cyclobacteriaceae bacterium]